MLRHSCFIDIRAPQPTQFSFKKQNSFTSIILSKFQSAFYSTEKQNQFVKLIQTTNQFFYYTLRPIIISHIVHKILSSKIMSVVSNDLDGPSFRNISGNYFLIIPTHFFFKV